MQDEGPDMASDCRLNWQLHFGEAPKWSEGVKFILVDVEPSPRDAQKAALVLQGDAGVVARQLQDGLSGLQVGPWRKQLGEKVQPFTGLLPERDDLCGLGLGIKFW